MTVHEKSPNEIELWGRWSFNDSQFDTEVGRNKQAAIWRLYRDTLRSLD
jgi:hypothetical protein